MRHYQDNAAEFITANESCMLQLDMSLGKTAICLTAIADLLDSFVIRGVLVVAPRRVAEVVWDAEAQAWDHTSHLSISVLRGRSKAALTRELLRPKDVHVINYESLPWLYNQIHELFIQRGRWIPWDMLIFDEVTRIKHPRGKRISPWHAKTKGKCLLDMFPRKVGLTGTPAPNGYLDLFGQYLAIDGGERLGVEVTDYKRAFFEEDQMARRLWLRPGAKEAIERRIADITISMEVDDYLELPPYVINDLVVDLPPKAREQYERLESDMFAEIDGTPLEVFNAASLTAKCRQVANGIVRHHEDPNTVLPVHDAKLEALDEVMEEAAGQGVLISYVFRPDLDRIMARYKKTYRLAYLGPGVNDREAKVIIEAWNQGEYHGLCLHHLSGGHGLNLQFGGHQVVWFGMDFNLEGYQQLNARLRRPGQEAQRVIIHRILARDTVDRAVVDAIERKVGDQRALRDAIKAYQRQVTQRKRTPK